MWFAFLQKGNRSGEKHQHIRDKNSSKDSGFDKLELLPTVAKPCFSVSVYLYKYKHF